MSAILDFSTGRKQGDGEMGERTAGNEVLSPSLSAPQTPRHSAEGIALRDSSSLRNADGHESQMDLEKIMPTLPRVAHSPPQSLSQSLGARSLESIHLEPQRSLENIKIANVHSNIASLQSPRQQSPTPSVLPPTFDTEYTHDLDYQIFKYHAKNQLIYKQGNHTKINFATLQRIRLQKLQAHVARDAVKMRYGRGNVPDWEKTLQEYIKAWQDYDYIDACASRTPDPFVLSTERTLDAWVLRTIRDTTPPHLRGEQYEDLNERNLGLQLDANNVQLLGGVRTKKNAEAKFKGYMMRLAMATVGGLFLIGPMLLMVLRNDRNTILITTSICVFVFGFVMAYLLDQPFNVLSATAAYAAVLVVFVGANTQATNTLLQAKI